MLTNAGIVPPRTAVTRRLLSWATPVLFLLCMTAWGITWSWEHFVAALLTVAVLRLSLHRISRPSPFHSAGILFLLYAGTNHWSVLIEAVAFGITPWRDALVFGARGTVSAAVVCILLVWLTAPDTDAVTGGLLERKSGLWWRIPLLGLAYLVLYFLAGMSIFPWVRDFYADKHLPAISTLIPLQFSRGLLSVFLILPLLSAFTGTRAQAVQALALIYAVLGGVAPLLLGGEFMPPAVRLAHAVEISATGCAFGLLVATLLLKPQRRLSAPVDSSTLLSASTEKISG